MRILVDFDPSRLVAKTLREQKRLVYNTVEAINKTALAAQAAIRKDMEQEFVLRRTTKRDRRWLLERVKLKFASVKKGDLYAELYLDQKPRLLLARFETGGQREPFTGGNIAVPVTETAREGGAITGGVKEELTFADLKLKPVDVEPDTRPDTVQFKGLQRTFLLKSTAKHPLGGVFQRVGPGKDDIRMIYSFHRAFQLKKLLNVFEDAKRVFEDKFRVELSIAYAREPKQ